MRILVMALVLATGSVSLADGVKLLTKEDIIPTGADRVLFVLAPALVLASLLAAMAVFPFSEGFYFADIELGVFFVLAMTSTTTIGVVMAGWSSNSKWSLYGAMREAAQVVAYEIPLGISLLVPIMVAGSFNLIEVSGFEACAAEAAAIDACPLDACAANVCGVNLCPADACAADACAVDLIPIIPFI